MEKGDELFAPIPIRVKAGVEASVEQQEVHQRNKKNSQLWMKSEMDGYRKQRKHEKARKTVRFYPVQPWVKKKTRSN